MLDRSRIESYKMRLLTHPILRVCHVRRISPKNGAFLFLDSLPFTALAYHCPIQHNSPLYALWRLHYRDRVLALAALDSISSYRVPLISFSYSATFLSMSMPFLLAYYIFIAIWFPYQALKDTKLANHIANHRIFTSFQLSSTPDLT